MSFQENLSALPDIAHLRGLDVRDASGATVRHIPAEPGKLGSLKLYHALAQEFDGRLNAAAAERGLQLFAEHVADAEANPGRHPNVDLLFQVKNGNQAYTLHPLSADGS